MASLLRLRVSRAGARGLRSAAPGARGVASTVAATAVAAALVFGLTACAPPEPAATGIQSPTPSASATTEWGAYSGKDDACSAVAGDVLTLALVPKNLALADPGGGVDDIDDTIREAADAAPPAITPNYLQLSAIVEAYGRDLAEWSEAVEAGSATATPTSTSTSTSTPTSTLPIAASTATPTPTPTPAGDAPERPAFVDTGYSAQLDRIKSWLTDTCG